MKLNAAVETERCILHKEIPSDLKKNVVSFLEVKRL